ncbi:MAG TPA: hypothetical protein PKA37_03845 [Planctomycetota bacterium]|jgi:hypothetical protein|nr:hypothetical protein [Planctomycetota bacterium]
MEIRFECYFEGKQLFQVLRESGEHALFTGTASQCQRFMEVYQEKVCRSRQRDRKGHRTLSASLAS